MGLFPADGVDGLVVHHRQHPRGDAPPGPVEGARVTPDGHEHVLQHVFREHVVGEDAPGQGERRPAEPLVEVIDGIPVARADATDEVGVVGFLLRTPCRTAHGSHRHTSRSQRTPRSVRVTGEVGGTEVAFPCSRRNQWAPTSL
jgi:hypothetical protein